MAWEKGWAQEKREAWGSERAANSDGELHAELAGLLKMRVIRRARAEALGILRHVQQVAGVGEQREPPIHLVFGVHIELRPRPLILKRVWRRRRLLRVAL